ncbi:unnamed protein product [Protopolystoma xenopodis]|uniref:PurM-like C-terminal domain-containing protein n=1 Tax=Protopolystoma xenopodis TaxID=117903 RepID=A0A3S5BNI3_9PLAT|nr:unnamed protein product [Protopolystoma xenopodis]
MHKYGAHGCTDITGFGILGHAENLVRIQQSSVLFHIHTLPCLAGACQLSSLLDDRFKLFSGLSPETSGGLLVALPAKSAETFCRELTEIDGNPAWIIGEALTSTERKVILAEKPVILEVNHCDVPQSAVCCEN